METHVRRAGSSELRQAAPGRRGAHPIAALQRSAGNRAVSALLVQRDAQADDGQSARVEVTHTAFRDQALVGMGVTLAKATGIQVAAAEVQADKLTAAQVGPGAFAQWRAWGAALDKRSEDVMAQQLQDAETDRLAQEWADAHPVDLSPRPRPAAAAPAADGGNDTPEATGSVGLGPVTLSANAGAGNGVYRDPDGSEHLRAGAHANGGVLDVDVAGVAKIEGQAPSVVAEADLVSNDEGFDASAALEANAGAVVAKVGTADDSVTAGVSKGFGLAGRVGFRRNDDGNMVLHLGVDVSWFTGDLVLCPDDAEKFAAKILEQGQDSVVGPQSGNTHDPTNKL